MGYFSNGSEGHAYAAQWCARCVHEEGCTVWSLHLLHNYDECNKPESMLHDLIPREGIRNGRCVMFHTGGATYTPAEECEASAHSFEWRGERWIGTTAWIARTDVRGLPWSVGRTIPEGTDLLAALRRMWDDSKPWDGERATFDKRLRPVLESADGYRAGSGRTLWGMRDGEPAWVAMPLQEGNPGLVWPPEVADV